MTSGVFLEQATARLHEAGIETPRLDALILLSDALQQDKASVLAHPEIILTPKILKKLQEQTAQRSVHTPLAYIRGKVMFYGREFIINKHVLTPRPETETMIDLARGLQMVSRPQIADIGTGSGCIGITLALELPRSTVDLYDIDTAALTVAARNSKALNATSVHTICSDLLTGVSRHYDVIVANLPYVPDAHPINEAAKHEPKLALFSGVDGLGHYRKFWMQLAKLNAKPSYVITEALPSQHHALAMLARNGGYYLHTTHDFIQLFAML